MNRIIKYFLCLLMILMLGLVNVYGETGRGSTGETTNGAYVDSNNETKKENQETINSNSNFTIDSFGDSNDDSNLKCYYLSDDEVVTSIIKFSVKDYKFTGNVMATYGEDVKTNLKVKNLNDDISIGNNNISKISDFKDCPKSLLIVDNKESDIYVFNDKNDINEAYNYYANENRYILNNISLEELANSNSYKKIFGKLDAYTCRDLLGDNIIKLLNKGYTLVYIIVPILVIVLGLMDFGSAILQNNADEMKKNSKRFIKRLIMGIVVMILPTIINVIFYIVNYAKDPESVENYFNYVNSDICINSE